MRKLTFFLVLVFCLSMAQAQTNIMANFNGDFENDLTSWRFYEIPSSVGSTAVITSDAVSGTKAVKITYLDGATVSDRAFDNWDARPPVTGGQYYKFKAFLKSDQASGLVAFVEFGFFNSSGGFIGSENKSIALTSTYTEFTLQRIAPATATSAVISFRVVDGSGAKVASTMYVDNVRLYQVDTSNLLSNYNGDFELGNTNSWRYINIVNGTANTKTAVMSSSSHGGAYAAQITWDGADTPNLNEDLFDQYPITTPGQKLAYKAWAKTLGAPFMLRMHCTFFDASNTLISDHNDETWILTSEYTQHTWVLPTIPAGTVTTNIGFRAMNADGINRYPVVSVSCLIEDVELVPSVSTNINKSQKLDAQVFVNPANQIVITTSEKENLTIYNVSGQKQYEIKLSSNNTTINKQFGAGVYFVALAVDGQSEIRKVIIR